MDENRVSGTARNIGGKIEEGVGALTGNTKTQIQGKLDQASGAAQDLYGQAADAARESATGFDHSSEGNGGQIHNVVTGFTLAWVLGHLNDQLNDNGRRRNLFPCRVSV